jgi:hypothetical protein
MSIGGALQRVVSYTIVDENLGILNCERQGRIVGLEVDIDMAFRLHAYYLYSKIGGLKLVCFDTFIHFSRARLEL